MSGDSRAVPGERAVWRREGREEVHDFEILRVRRFSARSPRTRELHPFTLIECPDWVNVVALTVEGEIVLVRQYRHGVGASTLELPGGVVDPGEDPARAAVRELAEETGYAGDAPVLLGVVEPNPAIQTNRCRTYLIERCRPAGAPAPDAGEDLEVLTLPPEEVLRAARDGRITHALVLCALASWNRGWHDRSSPSPGTRAAR
jgi:8-oxo-dGTP pyrophosphatase MutT (NUDIX family)